MGKSKRENGTRSYYAEYHAVQPNGWLIGGVRTGRSSRFGDRRDAERLLATTIENNGGKGVCDGTVKESPLSPGIFIHCGTGPAQAIGGLCFRCGKKLTPADAKMAGYQHEVHELGIAYGAHFDLLTDPSDEDAVLPEDWEERYRSCPTLSILKYIPKERWPEP